MYKHVERGDKKTVVEHEKHNPENYKGLKEPADPPVDGTVGWEKIEVRAGSHRVVIEPKDL